MKVAKRNIGFKVSRFQGVQVSRKKKRRAAGYWIKTK